MLSLFYFWRNQNANKTLKKTSVNDVTDYIDRRRHRKNKVLHIYGRSPKTNCKQNFASVKEVTQPHPQNTQFLRYCSAFFYRLLDVVYYFQFRCLCATLPFVKNQSIQPHNKRRVCNRLRNTLTSKHMDG